MTKQEIENEIAKLKVKAEIKQLEQELEAL